MNKVIIHVICCLFVSSSQSQILRNYGVKSGITATNQEWKFTQYYSGDFSPDSKPGLFIGTDFEFFNHPNFSLITELNYIQKIVQKDLSVSTEKFPDGTGEMIRWSLGINYLCFTILGKGRMNLGLINPYMIVGLKMDIELNKKLSHDKESNFKDFDKFIIGVKYGIGIELNLFPTPIILELVRDDNIEDLFSNDFVTVKSQTDVFNIGILF